MLHVSCCTFVLLLVHQSSGEASPQSQSSNEGAFCMWAAFRMCPISQVLGGRFGYFLFFCPGEGKGEVRAAGRGGGAS